MLRVLVLGVLVLGGISVGRLVLRGVSVGRCKYSEVSVESVSVRRC